MHTSIFTVNEGTTARLSSGSIRGSGGGKTAPQVGIMID
jgi:hypothetical protein